MKPKAGDKITIVSSGAVVCTTVAATVTKPRPALSVRGDIWSNGHDTNVQALLEDEGAAWIRGWYLPDAPEVQACRAAKALSPQMSEARPPNPVNINEVLGKAFGVLAHEALKSLIKGDLTK